MSSVGGVKTDATLINSVSEKLHQLIENTNANVSTLNHTLMSRIEWITADQKLNRVRKYVFISDKYIKLN